jgi:hypothetical protein
MKLHLPELLTEPGSSLVGDAIGCDVIKWELRLFRGGVEVVHTFLASEETTPEVLMSNMIVPFLRTLEREDERP